MLREWPHWCFLMVIEYKAGGLIKSRMRWSFLRKYVYSYPLSKWFKYEIVSGCTFEVPLWSGITITNVIATG